MIMKVKIKKMLDILFLPLAFIFSFLFSVRINNFLGRLKDRIHSFHLKRKFKRCGKKFNTSTPYEIFGFKDIEIGDNVSFPKYTRIHVFDWFHNQVFTPQLIIGNNVIFNENIHIACVNKIVIESGVLIGSNVLITDHSHGNADSESCQILPKDRDLVSKGQIHIGENTWIGDSCSILPGVTIGKNCIIGCNSVVTKSFPNNCLIAGNPAKIIKTI